MFYKFFTPFQAALTVKRLGLLTMTKISLVVLLFHWLTRALAEIMKHFNPAGLSVAVTGNYQIVWARRYGYAGKKENRKVTTNNLLEPGLISKLLNAVGILQLVQQGKPDLYHQINQYLVNLKFPYDTLSHGKKITTTRLLSHSAGPGVNGLPGYQRDSAMAAVTDISDGRATFNTEAVR
jgi:CubicO group peptidase (beta-lactamase class C family)